MIIVLIILGVWEFIMLLVALAMCMAAGRVQPQSHRGTEEEK